MARHPRCPECERRWATEAEAAACCMAELDEHPDQPTEDPWTAA